MSLGKFGVSFAVAVWFASFGGAFCAVLDKIEHMVVAEGSDKSIIKAVENDRTFVENRTVLETQQSSEDGVGRVEEYGEQLVEESRKKNKNQKGLMERILPMMIIPFMVSTSMIPMMLVSLKFMILKSAFIGKIAILLILLNMFRRRRNGAGGVFNQNVNVNDVASEHYGYHGDEEYGAYVNRRKRRKRNVS